VKGVPSPIPNIASTCATHKAKKTNTNGAIAINMIIVSSPIRSVHPTLTAGGHSVSTENIRKRLGISILFLHGLIEFTDPKSILLRIAIVLLEVTGFQCCPLLFAEFGISFVFRIDIGPSETTNTIGYIFGGLRMVNLIGEADCCSDDHWNDFEFRSSFTTGGICFNQDFAKGFEIGYHVFFSLSRHL